MSRTIPLDFLAAVYGEHGPRLQANESKRPFVTLTFAQSVDAKIAGKGGKQLILSGKESMIMTHWMRTMHDGIMVGIGTAINDDPQLNTRHVPKTPNTTPPGSNEFSGASNVPRPIILDSTLRISMTCKLITNYKSGSGRRPWIICDSLLTSNMKEKKLALEEAGFRLIEVEGDKDGRLSLDHVLHQLCELGIRSLMVEGGAAVIDSFLSAQSKVNRKPIVDIVIVTIAPLFVGEAGIGYGVGSESLGVIRSELVGKDTVVAMKVI